MHISNIPPIPCDFQIGNYVQTKDFDHKILYLPFLPLRTSLISLIKTESSFIWHSHVSMKTSKLSLAILLLGFIATVVAEAIIWKKLEYWYI